MKFAALIATMALVQAVTRNNTKNGIADESYDTHYDTLNGEIWTKAKSSEKWQKDGVDQIKELNAWRGTGEGN